MSGEERNSNGGPNQSGSAPQHRPRVAGVIVAAGRGSRYGAADKVLLPLAGRPLLAWALCAFRASLVSELIIVVGEHTRSRVESILTDHEAAVPARIVVGGERRQDSVARGLAAVSASVDLVAIHDAARPLVSAVLIDQAIERALISGAAITASPVTDTLKRVDDDLAIVETVARDSLWAAQTPQVFNRELLARAIASKVFLDEAFTDEAALFEKLGFAVSVVPNPDPNPKVTHPGDLALIEAILSSRERAPESQR